MIGRLKVAGAALACLIGASPAAAEESLEELERQLLSAHYDLAEQLCEYILKEKFDFQINTVASESFSFVDEQNPDRNLIGVVTIGYVSEDENPAIGCLYDIERQSVIKVKDMQ